MYVVIPLLVALSVWSLITAARKPGSSLKQRVISYSSGVSLLLMACLLGATSMADVKLRLAHFYLCFGVAALIGALDAEGHYRFTMVIGGIAFLICAFRVW